MQAAKVFQVLCRLNGYAADYFAVNRILTVKFIGGTQHGE